MKPTSGPWVAQYTPERGWQVRTEEKDEYGGYDLLLAEIIQPGVHDETEANARLIAAAPELLEACKEGVRALTTEPGEMTAEDYQNIWDQLKAVIAMAEGE